VAARGEESHKAITHISAYYLPLWAVGVLNELMGWPEDLYLFPDRLIAVANRADKQYWSRKYHIGYYFEGPGGDWVL